MSRKNFIKIISPGPILPGSITTATARCGKSNCKCKTHPSLRHGPYYRWSGIIDGHKTTITLTKEEAEECIRRIENYKILKEKFNKVLKKALVEAPWSERSEL